MRWNLLTILVSTTVVGCAGDPELEPPPGAIARNGGGGGWDYNSDRWNELGERLPFGAVRPSTITRSQHVVWAHATGAPPCVGATPGVTGVALRGSHLDGDLVVGPDVTATVAGLTAPLAIGDELALSVTVRTEAEPVAAARSGALVLTRVADFRRPAATDEPRTRHVWPQYQAVYYPALACGAPVDLGVAIVGPAPRFADGQPGYAPDSIPGAFELYSTYHAGQQAALLVKAVFNLDLPLTFGGAPVPHVVPCGTAAPVGNELAFLAAFAIGNGHLVVLDDGSSGAGGGSGFGFEPEAPGSTPRWTVVFATQPGEAIRLSALLVGAGIGRALCHTAATAAIAGAEVGNSDLAWPAGDYVSELDAIMAAGATLAPDERAANPHGFRLASGIAARRLQAFAEGSALAERAAVVAAVQAQVAATRLGPIAGAVPTWGALRTIAAQRVQAAIGVETRPPGSSDAYDHALQVALDQPTCGDGVCGWDTGAGAPESCAADCDGPGVPLVDKLMLITAPE